MTNPWPNARVAVGENPHFNRKPAQADLAEACWRESRQLTGLALMLSHVALRPLERGLEAALGKSPFVGETLFGLSLFCILVGSLIMVTNSSSDYRNDVYKLASWEQWPIQLKLLIVALLLIVLSALFVPVFAETWLRESLGFSEVGIEFMQVGAVFAIVTGVIARAFAIRKLGNAFRKQALEA